MKQGRPWKPPHAHVGMSQEGHMDSPRTGLLSRFELPPLPFMAISPGVSQVPRPLVGREIDLDNEWPGDFSGGFK